MTTKEAVQKILEKFAITYYKPKSKTPERVLWLDGDRYPDNNMNGHPLNYAFKCSRYSEDLCESRTSYDRLLEYCSEMSSALCGIAAILSDVDSEELDSDWEDMLDDAIKC